MYFHHLSVHITNTVGIITTALSKHEDTTEDRFSHTAAMKLVEETPEPARQRELIQRFEGDSTCSYAVAKSWYNQWQDYVGIHHRSNNHMHVTEAPGLLEMDLHNDQNNEYIPEESWKHLLRWYGISPLHQLDRKHLYFKDEKAFDVCVLSPFSGIVEHYSKRFNRFEEIGYIECQLRKIFRIATYKRTRLWFSEKAQVSMTK